MAPMLGTVGVAPPGGEVRSSLVPERFGGNMDSPEVRPGTTVFLGVNVEGALFSLGDGHYRQGEGEACGTAVEGAMNSTVIVELVKGTPRRGRGWRPTTTGWRSGRHGRWRTRGASVRSRWCDWFEQLYGLHPMDAYQLLSQITEVPVANVVDSNYSVVVKARKSLLPAASAFDGLHDDLRQRAQSLPASHDAAPRKAHPWI